MRINGFKCAPNYQSEANNPINVAQFDDTLRFFRPFQGILRSVWQSAVYSPQSAVYSPQSAVCL
jgi:hypothetical protein